MPFPRHSKDKDELTEQKQKQANRLTDVKLANEGTMASASSTMGEAMGVKQTMPKYFSRAVAGKLI